MTIFKDVLRTLLPDPVLAYARSERARRMRARNRPRYALSTDEFRTILIDALHVRTGDVVFVHSSIDHLGLGFPFYGVLALIREVVGESGTVLVPTYPRLAAHESLLSGEVFDVRTSPSYTGILTEFARRQRGAIRSLNPTKSVVALGPHAHELTSTHADSPYPYDRCSPYCKLMDVDARIVGLGVSTHSMSFVHCVEDELKDEFPVRPYFPRLFDGRCVDYDGRTSVVPTYAHDPSKMQWRDIAGFVKTHVQGRYEGVCGELEIHGMPFFWARSRPLFEVMVDLARKGTTVYDRRVYERRS